MCDMMAHVLRLLPFPPFPLTACHVATWWDILLVCTDQAWLTKTRAKLASFLNASALDLAFVENASGGMNALLRSMNLKQGDAVLELSTAYGMVKNVLGYMKAAYGVEIITAVLPPLSPNTTAADLVAPIAAALAADSKGPAPQRCRIKLVTISHITSEPAVVLPVEQIAAVCAAHGIPLVVDGAHATGQIPVNIGALSAAGVRGYVGDGHKWLFSGKGSAVLWLHPELQEVVVPPVISSEGKGTSPGECSIKSPWSPWMDQFSYVGARDYAAYATMGDAIDFREWVCAAQPNPPPLSPSTTDCVIEQINAQRLWATSYLVKRWGTAALLPAELTPAMAQVRLPSPGPGKNASVYASVHPRLLAEEGIEIVMRQGYDTADPVAWWTRLSCQIYLGEQDIVKLGEAVWRIVVGTGPGLKSDDQTSTERPWLGAAARGLTVDERVELLAQNMTQPEKVAQLLSAHVDEDTTDILADYGRLGFGVACLPPRHGPDNASLQLEWRNALQSSIMKSSRLGIPVSFRGELLHSGAVSGSVVFPMPCLLGTTWNRSLVTAVAAASAEEATASGIDYGFGPVLQIATDARWGRMNEAYGEDPTLVTELGLAATIGFQGPASGTGEPIRDRKKLPMQAKHFGMYGAVSHDTLPVDLSLTTLHDVYLRPFRAFVTRGGGRALMASHPPIRFVPAVANRWLLTNVLRREWGPAGSNITVASDCGDVGALCVRDGADPAMPASRDDPAANWGVAANKAAAAALALTAGLDQELDIGMGSFKFVLLGKSTDPLVLAAIDRAVRNVLRLKFASGLMDRPAVLSAAPVDREPHKELARDAVRQGAVLLINRGDALPFVGLSRAKIAVVGPLGDGFDAQAAMLGGYSAKPAVAVATLFSALRTEASRVSFSAGASPCNATVDAAVVRAAVAAAASADLVLVAVGDSGGLECVTCGEGRDRTDLDLPGSQLPLLQAVLEGVDPKKTKVVVTLIHGRPVTFGGDDRCGRFESCHNQLLEHPALSAVVAAWHPGVFGGPALVDLLTGRAPFVGKLTQGNLGVMLSLSLALSLSFSLLKFAYMFPSL